MNAFNTQFLKRLFLDHLAEMYDGEQAIAKALSGMTNLAWNPELRQTLQTHAYDTVEHISSVAEVFAALGEPSAGLKGHAVSRLLVEASGLVSPHEKWAANDMAIISAAQKLQHFAIANYTCLRDWAKMLNCLEAVVILEAMLEKDNSFDHKLAHLAEVTKMDLPSEEWSDEQWGELDAVAHQGNW